MTTPLEHILTNEYKAGMVTFLNKHPEYFEEAIELATSDKQPYAWCSAWLLWSCLDKYSNQCQEHIDIIIESITSKKDGHQRELLKILYALSLNEAQEGVLYNLCVNLWLEINKKPSIRYAAFSFIIKIAAKHPDLIREINFLTEKKYLESLSPGVKKGVEKLFNTLIYNK